jgi:serine/threonine protein kinase/tetratricopeptide (TPR) repeat protein
VIGQTLGPYTVLSKVGAGGMGEIYRARDPRLGRDVAIKVLPVSVSSDPGRLQRFEREARAVAALSHPNILAVFDVGSSPTPYLVTELLEGETLRGALEKGPLPPKRTVEVAMQLVAGLVAAHDRGIVHRDLKPENVFLTRDGVVKILDFGLAKAAASADGSGEGDGPTVTRAGATEAGTVVGTVGYMSPEQVRGQTADPRSDLFATGAMLYEMLSGRRAFQGATPADTMSLVLREAPPELTLPPGTSSALSRVTYRCLEKNPADRFQSARDLKFSLESMAEGSGVAPPATNADESSVAVLPFANLSADADNQYFSDGLSEELITALARLPGLRVASRTSSFRFRDGAADVRDIGSQLHVTSVLEGSVRRAGQRLRVTAQLVNVADGYQLWSERYDREMTDVFEIQDGIVGAIVKALAPALTGEASRAVRRGTENPEAYELYLKGRHYWHQRSPATVRLAAQNFQQAIALDPVYALPYCGLADCYGILRVYGWTRAEENRDLAAAAVASAIRLGPDLAEANFSQAFYTFYFARRWREAAQSFARARALDPRSSLNHGYSALFATMERQMADARRFADCARELDPLSPFIHGLSSCAFYVMGDFDEAERSSRRALELQSDYLLGLWTHGLALCGLARFDEGLAALEHAIAVSRAPFFLGAYGLGLARAGQTDRALGVLKELEERASRGEYVPAHTRLNVHVGLGDLAAVRRELAQALDEVTPPFSLWVTNGVFLDACRSDPEVDRLLDAWYEGAPPAR